MVHSLRSFGAEICLFSQKVDSQPKRCLGNYPDLALSEFSVDCNQSDSFKSVNLDTQIYVISCNILQRYHTFTEKHFSLMAPSFWPGYGLR